MKLSRARHAHKRTAVNSSLKEEPHPGDRPPHTSAGDPCQQPKVVKCITKINNKYINTCTIKTEQTGLEET